MICEGLKRIIDLASSLILAVLFLPIWILIPVLIKLDSDGPIFFLQRRVGKNGKQFNIIKFRTMIIDADDFWNTNPELHEKFKKGSWKLTLDEDPRITPIGKALRQTSIDEFPQVFNILMGDMSLVGPRPIRPEEVKDAIKRYGTGIKSDLKMSFTVKPGLTGPWQVAGRNDIPWDRRITIDAKYAKDRSIWRDIKIILKTPFAMLSKW